MRGKQGARRGGRRAVVGGQARGEKRDSEPPDGELRVLGRHTYSAAPLMARLVRIPLDVNTWEA
jgi:hypothetical protein